MTNLNALAQPQPLAKMAFEAIREAIISGQLRSGEIYNEKALAGQLGISRTPVREALLELSVVGLITFLPRRGIIINDYNESDIEEIFQLRQAIEQWVIAQVAEDNGKVDLKALEKSLADQQKSLEGQDFLAFMGADRAFHTLLADQVGNKRLISVLEGLRDMIQVMGLSALARPGRADEVLAEHRRMLDAIKAGDAQAARRAMLEHLDNSRPNTAGDPQGQLATAKK